MDTQHNEQLRRVENKLDEHLLDTTRHIEGVRLELQVMRENHLTHIQAATERQADSSLCIERRLGEAEKIAMQTKTNQDWLMRYHWIVATASLGALIASIMGLIMK